MITKGRPAREPRSFVGHRHHQRGKQVYDRRSLNGQVEAEIGGSGFLDIMVYHKTGPD